MSLKKKVIEQDGEIRFGFEMANEMSTRPAFKGTYSGRNCLCLSSGEKSGTVGFR